VLGFVKGVGRIVQEICRRDGYGTDTGGWGVGGSIRDVFFFLITGVYGGGGDP